MPVKLTSKQYRVLAVAIAVAAISLLIGLRYFSRAFPEATIRFQVNRSGSEQIASQFLAQRGFLLNGYRHAAVFDYDDTAKLYLERTQGLNRMDELTRGPLHLWRWSHRWFKPGHKQEFTVDVTPSGQVVGFNREIREDAPGASLSERQALSLAENFLTGVMKLNANSLAFVGAESLKRPARMDYAFTWKRTGVNLGAGSLRIAVGVDGDQIAAYQEYVKIPEEWLRSYERLRSRNDAAQVVDQVFWILLSLAMLVALVQRLRDRDVPIRLSFGLGLAAAALAFLSRLNTFPLAEFSYPTTEAFSSFVSSYVSEALVGAIGLGALIFLVVACSEPVYREHLPGLVSFRRYFSWRGLRSRSFFMANVVGITLTFFFFAYQTVFYLAANRLGAWAPSDIPFSNQLNTHIPWVAVLFGGFFPAVSEEMQFRAFAIPFLKKVTRSWPLAVALAAFNWGFLHSAYPNEPFFIRGVEVGIGGIIIGVIMLRFGILATLMWHYSVDALYSAFVLLRSSNHYLMFSGGLSAGVMLIPLLVSAVAYVSTGAFAEEESITNAAEGISRPVHPVSIHPDAPVVYSPLSRRMLRVGAALIVIFGALAFIKVYRLGQGLKVKTTRAQAVSTAEQFLAAHGVNTARYRRAAWLRGNVDPLAVRYLLERLPVRRADQIIRAISDPWLWEARFFRPLMKEEYRVFVAPATGRVFGFEHLLDETAPGASLTPAQAQALGEKAAASHGYDLHEFALQGIEAHKRKAREDYTLVWQAQPSDPRDVGGARYRLAVEIAGDQVTSFSRYLKLPEQWLRRQQSTTLANSSLLGIRLLLIAGLVAGAVWLFVRQLRQGAIRWLRALKVAIVLAVLFGVSELNQLSSIDRAYNTSVSLLNFRLRAGISMGVSLILAGLCLWLVIGLAASLYPEAWQALQGNARRIWRRDAVIALAVSIAVSAGIEKLLALVADHAHAFGTSSFPSPPQGLDAFLPGIGAFVRGLVYAAAASAVLGVLIYGVSHGWRRRSRWLWLGGVFLLVALGPPGAHSLAQWGAVWLLRFIPLVAAVALIALFFRDNPLAYVLAAFVSAVAGPLVELFSQPARFFHWNGLLLGALTAVVIIWLLFAPGSRSQLLEL
ncbi:MAG: CPBP family glutamic-type intramembrane protease [Terriglobia bacterium]